MSAIEDTASEAEAPPRTSWTAWALYRIKHTVPEGQWLPERQPAYVASWIYVFGMATLVSLFIVIGSGVVLALNGSEWWHTSNVGPLRQLDTPVERRDLLRRDGDPLVGQVLDGGMARRQGPDLDDGHDRATCRRGHRLHRLPQPDQLRFPVDRRASQGRPELVGLGAWFNALNPAQALTLHIVVLPLAVGAIVIMHVILVRRHGVVPPIGAEEPTS